ncbi:RraA family protein [Bacteroidota bacterium]
MKTTIFLLLTVFTTSLLAQTFDELPGVKAIQELSDEELVARVSKCRPADLGDAMDAFGLISTGTMSHKMRPIREGISFAGIAYTVKFVPAVDPAVVCKTPEEYFERLDQWNTKVYGYEDGMKDGKAKDKVFVMDMSGQSAGNWGSHNGIFWTYGAEIAGIVVDGSIRDTYEANIEGIKGFCTRRTFDHPYHRIKLAGVNIPIQCDGVQVNPGDIISADDDGVLVIPREYIAKVLYLAEEILDRDQQARAKSYKEFGLTPDETLGPYK